MSDVQGPMSHVPLVLGTYARKTSFPFVMPADIVAFVSSPLYRKGMSGQPCPAVSRHFKRKLTGRKRSRCVNLTFGTFVRENMCCEKYILLQTHGKKKKKKKKQRTIAVNPNQHDEMPFL